MKKQKSDSFKCTICPHECRLKSGQVGICGARKASKDGIYLEGYSRVSTMAIEPIEKKPFYHFFPGSKILSVGGYGCNLSCNFCVTGDTLITTPNGLKRIDQISDGDAVIAYDYLSDDPQLVSVHADHVFDREVQEVIELEVDGQTIQLTGEHPVMTRRGWVEAKDLTTDDEVLCDKTYSAQCRSLLKSGIAETGKKE